MPDSINNSNNFPAVAKYIIGVITTIVGLLLLWYFRDILGYIVVSAVLAVIGAPLVNLLRRIKFGKYVLPAWLAALIVLFIIIGTCVALFALFVPLIFNRIAMLASVNFADIAFDFRAPIAKFQTFLQDYFSINVSAISISDAIANQFDKVFNYDKLNNFLGSIVSGVATTIISLFAVFFITFFFLKDDNLFLRILLAVTPTKYEDNVKHAVSSATALLSRYFLGILAESFIMATIVSISLMCCGYMPQDAIFIGIIVGILNVIPYVGPWIGFGISLLVSIAFVGGDTTIAFIVLSLVFTISAAQLIDNIILQPLLYSNSVNAHPLEIFIVILMAGHFAGVWGMLFAIPAYTVLRVIGKEFFNNFKIVRKLTENM